MLNGKVFEVGTEVHQIEPRPEAVDVEGIVYAAFVEAMTLPQKDKQQVGNYLAELSKKLLEKEGK